MKQLVLLAPLLAAAAFTAGPPAAATPTPAASETYAVDPVHSGVQFRVKHLGLSYFHGRFNEIRGQVELDESDFTKSSVALEIPAESVDTNNGDRDQHLRSSDFFDVEQFPMISFESTSIRPADGEDRYEVTGQLELRGVKKKVTADFLSVGRGETPFGDYRAGFEATFTIERSDFGMTYWVENGGLGDEVEITVFLEAVRQSEEG